MGRFPVTGIAVAGPRPSIFSSTQRYSTTFRRSHDRDSLPAPSPLHVQASEMTSASDTLRIRPFRSGDEPDLAHICCGTGDSGKDGSGLLADDRIWGDIWVLPYAKHDPTLAWVVEDGEGHAIGYTVSTTDTDTFNSWFKADWWPEAVKKYNRSPPEDGAKPSRTETTLGFGDTTGSKPLDAALADYPAHLHIDLMPPAQGKGLGRKLIMTNLKALQDKGVKGVHLGASATNEGACAFYRKLGFKEVPTEEKGVVWFAWDLTKPL